MCYWWATLHCKSLYCNNTVRDGHLARARQRVRHPDDPDNAHARPCPARCGRSDETKHPSKGNPGRAIRPTDGRTHFEIKSRHACSGQCDEVRPNTPPEMPPRALQGLPNLFNPAAQALTTSYGSDAGTQAGLYSGGYGGAQTYGQQLPSISDLQLPRPDPYSSQRVPGNLYDRIFPPTRTQTDQTPTRDALGAAGSRRPRDRTNSSSSSSDSSIGADQSSSRPTRKHRRYR